jgi:hypothetical protein
MRDGSLGRALRAAALAAVLAGGCGRPPDEAWLRFVGFKSSDKTIAVITCTLDGKFEEPTGAASDAGTATPGSVDAALENASFVVGRGDDPGVGILLNRVHIEYSMPGAPAYDLPVSLYIAAPSKAGEVTSATLSDLPVVPVALEQWLVAHGYAEASFSARVTFFAEADDGTDLETSGGVSVVLNRP